MTHYANERRRFERISLDRNVYIDGIEHEMTCQLIDISMRGLLMRYPSTLILQRHQQLDVTILLDEQGEHRITVRGEITHLQDDLAGLHIRDLDLESSVNLRRLIELNLDDPQQLERELQSMLHDTVAIEGTNEHH
jgi:hypothetical protein